MLLHSRGQTWTKPMNENWMISSQHNGVLISLTAVVPEEDQFFVG